MSALDLEASLRDVRATVLAIWSRGTDPMIKQMADDASPKLSAIMRVWHRRRP